jgi:hypothetical protein
MSIFPFKRSESPSFITKLWRRIYSATNVDPYIDEPLKHKEKSVMSGENRYGTALLAFNTKRQPDPDRGKGIKHFELFLPAKIKEEIDKWDRGDSSEFSPLQASPRKAAKMLWSTDTASYLDGRIDAWKDVPYVMPFLNGWQVIAKIKKNDLPKNREELRKIICEANPGLCPDPTRMSFRALLPTHNHNDITLDKYFNDLVLIFKYAAVDHQRPIDLVVDLYRLARTALPEFWPDEDEPSTPDEMFNWLTAPLIVPRVFTTPLGPSGPRSPSQGGFSKPPDLTPLDKDSPRGRAIIEQIVRDLDEIEKNRNEEITIRALHSAGVEDSKVIAKVINASRDNNAPSLSANRKRIIRQVTSKPTRQTPRVITTNIGGFPVRVNMAEIQKRADHNRREVVGQFINTLPEYLKDRVSDVLGDSLFDYEIQWPSNYELAWPIAGYTKDVDSLPSYLEPAGRTDLLLVRQTTIGYRRAEIAHVENVLIGETRDREHTKRILSREELFESTERESEETTDLQTTDRSELSYEVNEVVAENLRAEGSVEVTYRGATKVVAKAAGSFESSTENAANTATEYAQETIEHAVKRMFERIKREARSLFEQEIVELNRHNFSRDNNEKEHVSGIYQYLERISWAKIFSYGERDIYDILVPEPAALIWELAISSEEREVPKDPLEESGGHDLFKELTLDNIADKQNEIIKAFRVVDFPPILKQNLEQVVTFSDRDNTGSTNNIFAANKTIRIKDGYIVEKATLSGYAENEQSGNDPQGSFTVGSVTVTWKTKKGGDYIELDPIEFEETPLEGPEVGVAVTAENYNAVTAVISLHLTLTPEKLHEWQLEAYSRVAERYEQMQQDYQQAKNRAEAFQPEEEVNLPVGARRRLKNMVRNELQRAAIGIMRNEPVEFSLIKLGPKGEFPTVDLSRLATDDPVIRFLQQAFEWEHLSWILYPYFWGRRSQWKHTVVQDHPDPDFSAFLNAGAARLQISVRPGFENLVKHFMETGEVYEGNGIPKMGDPGYVPFIDEQINALGGPGDEVPWPSLENQRQWEVVSPTPLVLVRKATEEQLPTWDKDTGGETPGGETP